MVVLMIEKDDKVQGCALEILDILQHFSDIIPGQLLNVFLSQWSMDHEIKLLLGVKTPTRVPCQMAPSELTELQK